ncbi:excalibur calcium-binding domain-containing protein [Streptomyces sp. NPDC060194]|uniref:excalibur calcium-binding domain-containing protein n=1 Tax=Streptomyces sp. NPDC060194 TaxID=3347069 RepID=UPI00365B9292
MRIKHIAAAAALTAAVTVPSVGAASAVDRDCKDFSSSAAAQEYFDTKPGDPDRLDRDNDDLACEDYRGPWKPAGADTDPTEGPAGTGTDGTGRTSGEVMAEVADDYADAPKGGVEAGGGGLAKGGSDTALVTGLGLAGALAAAGGAVVLRRRGATGR